MSGSDVVGLVYWIALTIVGVPAFLVLVAVLVPRYLERAQGVLRGQPARSMLIGWAVLGGFIVALVLVAILLGLLWSGFVSAAQVIFLIGLPVLVLLGLLVGGAIVGERILSRRGERPINPIASLALGSLALELSLLVPVLGWLLVLGVVAAGLGAGIVALFARERGEPTV